MSFFKKYMFRGSADESDVLDTPSVKTRGKFKAQGDKLKERLKGIQNPALLEIKDIISKYFGPYLSARFEPESQANWREMDRDLVHPCLRPAIDLSLLEPISAAEAAEILIECLSLRTIKETKVISAMRLMWDILINDKSQLPVYPTLDIQIFKDNFVTPTLQSKDPEYVKQKMENVAEIFNKMGIRSNALPAMEKAYDDYFRPKQKINIAGSAGATNGFKSRVSQGAGTTKETDGSLGTKPKVFTGKGPRDTDNLSTDRESSDEEGSSMKRAAIEKTKPYLDLLSELREYRLANQPATSTPYQPQDNQYLDNAACGPNKREECDTDNEERTVFSARPRRFKLKPHSVLPNKPLTPNFETMGAKSTKETTNDSSPTRQIPLLSARTHLDNNTQEEYHKKLNQFFPKAYNGAEKGDPALGHLLAFDDFVGFHNITNDALAVKLFKMTLTSGARAWFQQIDPNISMEELRNLFLSRYYLDISSRNAATDLFYNFARMPSESWAEAVGRLKLLNSILRYPEIFMLDKIKNIVPVSIRVKLNEIEPNSLDDIIKIVNFYEKSGLNTKGPQKNPNPGNKVNMVQKNSEQTVTAAHVPGRDFNRDKASPDYFGSPAQPEPRHLNEPNLRPHYGQNPRPNFDNRGPRQYGQGPGRPITCWRCGKNGHIARTCDRRGPMDANGPPVYRNNRYQGPNYQSNRYGTGRQDWVARRPGISDRYSRGVNTHFGPDQFNENYYSDMRQTYDNTRNGYEPFGNGAL